MLKALGRVPTWAIVIGGSTVIGVSVAVGMALASPGYEPAAVPSSIVLPTDAPVYGDTGPIRR